MCTGAWVCNQRVLYAKKSKFFMLFMSETTYQKFTSKELSPAEATNWKIQILRLTRWSFTDLFCCCCCFFAMRGSEECYKLETYLNTFIDLFLFMSCETMQIYLPRNSVFIFPRSLPNDIVLICLHLTETGKISTECRLSHCILHHHYHVNKNVLLFFVF